MKIATSTGDFARFIRRSGEALPYLRQAGFRYVDYDFCSEYRAKRGVYGEEWEAYVEWVAGEAARLDMCFVQAHAPMGRPIVDRAIDPDFLEATHRSIRVAARLGIPNIVVHSGYEEGLTPEETLELNRRFFAAVLAEAEKYPINILVENFNKMCCATYWIDNATDLRRLIDLVDHPQFHACWDIGHANLQEMPQDEEMRVLGHHIKALHINDNGGVGDDHLEIYSGTVNMDAVMHGLADVGYTGYFTFESAAIPSGANRRTYEKDTRLFRVPLDVCIKQEEVKYQIGKSVLSAYGLYEE